MSKIHEIGPASTRWRCRWEALRSIGSDILNFLSIGRRVYGRTEMDVTGRLLVSVFIRKFRRHATGYDRPWLTFTADPFIFLLFSSGRKKLLFDLFPVACVMSIEDELIRHLAPFPPPPPKSTEGSSVANGSVDFFFFFAQRSGTKQSVDWDLTRCAKRDALLCHSNRCNYYHPCLVPLLQSVNPWVRLG